MREAKELGRSRGEAVYYKSPYLPQTLERGIFILIGLYYNAICFCNTDPVKYQQGFLCMRHLNNQYNI